MTRFGVLLAVAALMAACSGPSTSGIAGNELRQMTEASIGRSTTGCTPGGCLYVATFAYKLGATINAYPIDGKFQKPVARIYGRRTRLNQPMGITFDTAANVYVTNLHSITVYGAGSFGINDEPIARITGSKTGLDNPRGIAVDQDGNVYVANDGSLDFHADSITVYAASATGNVKPIRKISGMKTGLYYPTGIAFDSSGDLYVANASLAGGTGTITVYAPGTNGNVLPIRSIGGLNTQLASRIGGIAFDAGGNLYVANNYDGGLQQSIAIFAAGSSGNVAPIQTIAGDKTGLNNTTSVAVDAAGNVFAGCSVYDGIVEEFAAGVYGNNYPTQSISGFTSGTKLRTNVYGILAR